MSHEKHDEKHGGKHGSREHEKAGISGYLASDRAHELMKTRCDDGTVDINFEPGSDKIVFRVRQVDIRGVVKGETKGEETLVHLMLAPDHRVETVIRALRDVQRIDDPTLHRLTAAASVSVSFV